MSEETEGQEGQEPDKGDFNARLENDHGFAVQEYKKMQSEQSKTFEKLKAFQPIADMLEAAPTATMQDVVNAVTEYSGFLNDSEMAEIIQEFKTTGKVPKPPAPTTEEGTLDSFFDTEEVPNKELEELRKQVAALEARGDKSDVVQSKSDVRDHLQRYFTEDLMAKWLTDEQKDEVLKDIEAQMLQMGNQKNGAQALQSLNYESIDLLATRKTKTWYAEIAERARQAALQEKQTHSTGSAVGISTNGEETPPPKAFNKGTAAVDAVREFRRREARGEV